MQSLRSDQSWKTADCEPVAGRVAVRELETPVCLTQVSKMTRRSHKLSSERTHTHSHARCGSRQKKMCMHDFLRHFCTRLIHTFRSFQMINNLMAKICCNFLLFSQNNSLKYLCKLFFFYIFSSRFIYTFR